MVGNYSLGSGGFVSRLYQQVREQRGLVYGVNSSFSPLLGRGTFTLSLQTRSEELDNAEALTRTIFQQFLEAGITTAELAAAQKNRLGGFALDLASNSDMVAQLVRIGFYRLPLDYLDNYCEKISSLTVDAIHCAFQTHLNPQALTKISVGPEIGSTSNRG